MSREENNGGPFNSMHKETKNNNKQTFLNSDDANANQIPMEESNTGRGSLIPPLVSQERIIIWGTHARSKDPELEEFELLECQEMEAFPTDHEVKDNVAGGKAIKKDFCQRQSTLAFGDSASELTKTDQNANHSADMAIDLSQPLDLRTSASRSEGRRSLKETRSNSESNVFVPTFLTVSNLSGSLASALDSAGHTQCPPLLPSKPTSEKYHFQQPGTNKSLILLTQIKDQTRKRDQIPCSAIISQDPTHEHRSNTENSNCQKDRQIWSTDKGYNKQESILSSKFQKNFGRVPPSCRQLVRPLSPGMEPKLISGHPAYKDTSQGEHLSPSSDREPKNNNYKSDVTNPIHINSSAQSLSSGSGFQSTQTSTKVGTILRRQGSAENASIALDRKSHLSCRAYSSPTRSSTPPSPKNTGSPQRRPTMSPGRTRVTTRGPQLGYSASQGYGFGLRPPVKTTINMNVQNPVPQQSSTVTSSPPKCPQKPKRVRPKIITYIRKSPQVQATDSPHEISSLPTKLSTSTSPPNSKTPADEPPGAPLLNASNLLYDKYRQELQKSRYISSESRTKPSSHTMPHKAIEKTSNFYGSFGNKYLPAMITSESKDPAESLTVTQETGGFLQPPRTLRPQLGVGAVSKSSSAAAAKSRIFTAQKSSLALSQPVQAVTPSVTAQATSLITPSTQSPPEASARLAAFGFVRSSSVSSVPSNPPTNTRSDQCKPVLRPGSVTEDPPFHRVITASCGEGQRVPCRNSPQPPSTPVPIRRPLLPPPPGSPVGSRKDFQKPSEGSHSVLSSPKRLAVVSPKPQSPVLQRQRAAAARVPGVPGGSGVQVTGLSFSPGSKKKKQEVQRTEKEQEDQEKREGELLRLQAQCKEQNGQLLDLQAELKRTLLGLDVLAICTQHFHLKCKNAEQKETELSQELRQIQEEVACSSAQWKLLQQEKSALEQSFVMQLKELQEQQEAELATLEEELRAQYDQVDMLRFQNQALQDKAKRFETALRKSTDEQILDALAPYKHIEQDLRSLKEVLEMKNQQIHDQERKICHLEKAAQKNIYLEEKVQVLQQQNEDLKARIDRNTALSRQLSEENANLQGHVERESNEKKRLSRNNEELLWLLQTSPHLSPSSSPSHRVFFPGFDNLPFPGSSSPETSTESNSCPYTPSHKVGSPIPSTPTHRGSPAARSSPGRVPNANMLPK
ncbi:Microtubule-associated tumor suppressor candidate 2 [Bagarius yarrelli]|uniref:Microtubule-associated tumor suppressor candidate 2 n=1 Tax=Bagarius yarrelli TaxID=175774 RepID=A0A556TJV3_BAGYA|nr:Microtubule-associated tumor suppressor candidate 2 [Bagarius yarrelli]